MPDEQPPGSVNRELERKLSPRMCDGTKSRPINSRR
jgi:hypothetical protein